MPPSAHQQLVTLFALSSIFGAVLIALWACSGERQNGAPAQTQAEPAQTQAAPQQAPAAPQETATRERARAAFGEERYEEVCAFLTTQRFSPEVCDFLAQTARGTPAQLPDMGEWLTSQGVRRLEGTIVGPRDASRHEYDVLVRGEPMIIIAELTPQEIAHGHLDFWVQLIENRDVEAENNQRRSLPVYREWSLWFLIQEANRGSSERRAGQARSDLEHLIDAWESTYAAPDGAPDLPPPSPEEVAAAEEAAREEASRPPSTLPFAGVWFTTIHPDIRLILTDTTYEYRFPFQGGTRRIRADITATDLEQGHLTLRYTAVLQDGQPVGFTPGDRYMHFQVQGTVLRRRIAEDAFPTDFDELTWMRIPDQYVGSHDR